MMKVTLLVLFLSGLCSAFVPAATNVFQLPHQLCSQGRSSVQTLAMAESISRKDLVVNGIGLLAGVATGLPLRSDAFDNRVAPPGKYPPTKGSPKKGVGSEPKDGTLLYCTGEPNCFSPATSREDDPDHYYAPWEYTKSKEQAVFDVMSLIKSYPPGQQKIDGGGWKIAKESPDYIWVQYESSKRGYIDDLEFAFVQDGKVQVRSSSRLGYLDYCVNAKRINWYVNKLSGMEGWKADFITQESHPRYFEENLPYTG